MKNTEERMKNIEARKKKIASLLAGDNYIPMTLDELCKVLDVPTADKQLFEKLINNMKLAGAIRKTSNEKYELAEGTSVVKGTIQGTARRFYFLIPDDKKKDDVFIPPENMNGAMHGDSVLVKVVRDKKDHERFRGVVIQVINERRDEVLGTYETKPEPGVMPFDKRIDRINVKKSSSLNVSDGDLVALDITHVPIDGRPASGVIKGIVADKSDPRAYYKYLIRSYGYEENYPVEPVKEAQKYEAKISPDEYKRRVDYRGLFTITIDGADAKDLDDAISIEKTPEGLYRLWVHIADVSHYVVEGSELDKEAADRGTSVYLVDKVIPMLPKVISNGLCSINPDEDKLAFSVRMDVDEQGKVRDYEIDESVIKSNQRMTYSDVFRVLQGEKLPVLEKNKELLPALQIMNELSDILSKKRRLRGAIDFDFDESKVILDSAGYPKEISVYERTKADKIIEEFMILCNETVAEAFEHIDFPFIYRIHDKPSQDKIKELDTFLKTIGYGIKNASDIKPGIFQNLIDKVKGKPIENLVSTVVLRSMQKAIYSVDNVGHFGLASEHYCHFTSPIRRYPDLMVHRLIKKWRQLENANKTKKSREIKLLGVRAASIADSSSEMERKSEQAERDLVDYYKAVYMQRHIGGEFNGVVSGITGFGMFVALENTVEGLVRVDNMDGYYVYDKERHSLYNKNGAGRYTIGKKVKVKILSVNVNLGEIDMVIADERKKYSRTSSKISRKKKSSKYRAKRRRK